MKTKKNIYQLEFEARKTDLAQTEKDDLMLEVVCSPTKHLYYFRYSKEGRKRLSRADFIKEL